MNRAEICFAL